MGLQQFLIPYASHCPPPPQVPALWQRSAYPSLKPLGAWVANFKTRMDFMASWLYDGEPAAFWLPGFFFPQGFLTAVLQNHARKRAIPIDRLSFDFDVTAHERHTELKAAPTEGVNVYGLFLESCNWDKASRCLQPSRPREMTSALPPVHFLPHVASPTSASEAQDKERSTYLCPLYKTSVRAGVLSTTGQSTNFVLHMSLPCAPGTDSSFFVLSGAACLCALDGAEE